MLYKVVQHFTQAEDKVCGHWNESYWVVLSHSFVYYSYNMLCKVILIFKSVDETLVCDHSNESYWAALSCGTVYYAVQGDSYFKSVDETLVCDHSNERYWAVLSRGTSYLLLTAQEHSKYWAMIHINISFSIFCKMIFLDPRQCFISIINLACTQSCVVYRCC